MPVFRHTRAAQRATKLSEIADLHSLYKTSIENQQGLCPGRHIITLGKPKEGILQETKNVDIYNKNQ